MLWKLPNRWQNTYFNFKITYCISFVISLQWWKWKLLTLGTRPAVLLITVFLLIDFFRSKPDSGYYFLDLSPTHNTVILILLTEFLEQNVWFPEQRCLCMKQIRTNQFKLYSYGLTLWMRLELFFPLCQCYHK